jgi:uncharacterized coiled-coil protein SlyX
MEDYAERFVDLELRYSHQSMLLDELNDELAHANSRIDELVKEVRRLREMLGNLAPQLDVSPDE